MAETKISKAQAGSGIWTSDSLVAGTNISITQVPQPVIDANTVSLFHFDETVKDEISGNNADVSSYHSFVDGKFGKAMQIDPTREAYVQITPFFKLTDGNYTLDYWAKAPTGRTSVILEFASSIGSTSNYNYFIQLSSNTGIFVGSQLSGTGSSFQKSDISAISSIYNFFHIAYVVDKDNLKVYLFLNGTKVMENTLTAAYIGGNATYLFRANGIVDEVRLSNTARWTSDFTPFTQPYAASAGPAKYQINNTKADPDLSSYLQNTATGTGSLTIEGVAATAGASVNFGVGSQATGSYAHSLGYYAQAGTRGVAVGHGAQATGNMATSIGDEAKALKSEAVALGKEANANAGYALAIGSRTTASAQYSIAIGCHTLDSSSARATATSAIQLGNGTNSTASTFQVFNTTVVNASGKIPAANLDTAIPDVTTKADTDLGNISAAGKSTAIGWGMPDYSAGISISATDYSCPSDGVIDLAIAIAGGTVQAYINGQKIGHAYASNNNFYGIIEGQYRVKAGDVFTFSGGTIQWAAFFPLKGAN